MLNVLKRTPHIILIALFSSCQPDKSNGKIEEGQAEYSGKVIPVPIDGWQPGQDSFNVNDSQNIRNNASAMLAADSTSIRMISKQYDSFYIDGTNRFFRVYSDVEKQTLILLDANDTLELADTTTKKSKTRFAENYITIRDYNRDGIDDIYIETYCAKNCGGYIYSYDPSSLKFRKVVEVQNFDYESYSSLHHQGGGSGRQFSSYYHTFTKDWNKTIILRFERDGDTARYTAPDGKSICILYYTKNDPCERYRDSVLFAHGWKM